MEAWSSRGSCPERRPVMTPCDGDLGVRLWDISVCHPTAVANHAPLKQTASLAVAPFRKVPSRMSSCDVG